MTRITAGDEKEKGESQQRTAEELRRQFMKEASVVADWAMQRPKKGGDPPWRI